MAPARSGERRRPSARQTWKGAGVVLASKSESRECRSGIRKGGGPLESHLSCAGMLYRREC
eukprot:412906-Prorocentrum_minimum.AAC.4